MFDREAYMKEYNKRYREKHLEYYERYYENWKRANPDYHRKYYRDNCDVLEEKRLKRIAYS